MSKEQILVGALVALVSLHGLWKADWLLEHTRKGQKLVGWLGPEKALWVLRGLLIAAVVFGVLLATNVVRPIRW